MKNIILCSDGTGNSGGICNSNVYRLFESLDLDATEVMEVTDVETEGKKKTKTWEQVNAYHAVAIDDERHSFHPRMWIESEPLDIAVWPLEIESKSSEPIPPKSESESDKHPIESGKSQSSKSKVIYGCLGDTYFEGIRKVERNPNQKVEQVWFTGMHSNVGGGYPKDQLAHVSLNWMIEKADDSQQCPAANSPSY